MRIAEGAEQVGQTRATAALRAGRAGDLERLVRATAVAQTDREVSPGGREIRFGEVPLAPELLLEPLEIRRGRGARLRGWPRPGDPAARARDEKRDREADPALCARHDRLPPP